MERSIHIQVRREETPLVVCFVSHRGDFWLGREEGGGREEPPLPCPKPCVAFEKRCLANLVGVLHFPFCEECFLVSIFAFPQKARTLLFTRGGGASEFQQDGKEA